jgi:hypothetical protein
MLYTRVIFRVARSLSAIIRSARIPRTGNQSSMRWPAIILPILILPMTSTAETLRAST